MVNVNHSEFSLERWLSTLAAYAQGPEFKSPAATQYTRLGYNSLYPHGRGVGVVQRCGEQWGLLVTSLAAGSVRHPVPGN